MAHSVTVEQPENQDSNEEVKRGTGVVKILMYTFDVSVVKILMYTTYICIHIVYTYYILHIYVYI